MLLLEKWFNTLVEGSDPGLSGAYKDMESAINEMSQAVNLATLRTVQILAEIVRSMEEGVEFIVTKTTFIDERTQRIESKVDLVINQGQVMDSKQDAVLAQQKEMSALMKKLYERERGGHEKTQEKDAKGHPGQRKAKTDPGENKRVALNEVTSFFSNFSSKWRVVSKETKTQRKEINVDSVHGTATWLLKDEETYKAWANQEKPVVWMRGNAGIGKSFLAEAVVTSLETSSTERKSFAYFFFREEEDNLRSFTEARKGI
jgi:predicted ATPase